MQALPQFITTISERLAQVAGVQAVVLGGSYATGTNKPDSDIDLGIYYANGKLDTPAIRLLAGGLNDTPNPVVTDVGGWGRWVNGGAWLTIHAQRVDFLYKDLDFMRQVIADCREGRYEVDFYQQPPFGFFSYSYLAQIQTSIALFDPHNLLAGLKNELSEYPPALKTAIVRGFLWDAEFSLVHGKKAAGRGDVFNSAGCLVRTLASLVQVVYALNEVYFLSEKQLEADLVKFKLKPADFIARLTGILGQIGRDSSGLTATARQAEALLGECLALGERYYQPKFLSQ